jgi:diguanylate cyclase (GGDEF)-like protein
VAIAQAERSGKRLALMFVDLDRFKSVNDIHGHDLGDRVLRELATRITSCMRGTDTVSRQGGDEFVILLPEIDSQEDALPVARKLLAELEAPLLMDDIEIVLGASIGIACFPEDGQDHETLLCHADAAMYLAKSLGRDRYQFYSAMS